MICGRRQPADPQVRSTLGGWAWLCSAFALFCLLWPAFARAEEQADEFQVKAVFTYNFLKFTSWPDALQEDQSRHAAICVFGENPFGGYLDEIVKVGGLPNIEVRYFPTGLPSGRCQIAFLEGSDLKSVIAALEEQSNKSVLTVGDSPDFLASGGMIQFIREDDKVRFRIAYPTVKASNVTISSKLLALGVK